MLPLGSRPRLERAAVIAQAFVQTQEAVWSGLWPSAYCMPSSLLLAPFLRVPLHWDLRVAVGVAHDCRPHAWVESPEGDIIDPTYGMFDYGEPLRVLPTHRSGELGHWAEIRLSLDEEEFYRRSLTPGGETGWSEECRIHELFSDYPRIAPRH